MCYSNKKSRVRMTMSKVLERAFSDHNILCNHSKSVYVSFMVLYTDDDVRNQSDNKEKEGKSSLEDTWSIVI